MLHNLDVPSHNKSVGSHKFFFKQTLLVWKIKIDVIILYYLRSKSYNNH